MAALVAQVVKPLVVGHRANSWRRIRRFLSIGVPVIEIDVVVENGEVFLKHADETEIAIMRGDELGRLHEEGLAAVLTSRLFRRIKLVDVLSFLSGRADVLLDLKLPGMAERVAEAVRLSGFRGRVYVSSKYHANIKLFKELMPGVTGLITLHDLPVDVVDEVRKSEADGVSINAAYVDKEVVDLLHREGFIVDVWTVNSPQLARVLASLGVDMITTDNPEAIMRVLGVGPTGPGSILLLGI